MNFHFDLIVLHAGNPHASVFFVENWCIYTLSIINRIYLTFVLFCIRFFFLLFLLFSSVCMSVHDRSPTLATTPDGLRCQSRHQKEWHGIRATRGVISKGKWYFEALVEDEGLCRVGWATSEASLDLGTCPKSFGFGGTGKKSNNRQFDDYGEPFGKKDVIGCYLDMDAMYVAFTKNGRDLGVAFHIDQNAFRGKPFFPAVVLKNAEMSFNFGASEWRFPPEEPGFVGIVEATEADSVPNPKMGGGAAAERKLVANAPQALIIEVKRSAGIAQGIETCNSFSVNTHFFRGAGPPLLGFKTGTVKPMSFSCLFEPFSVGVREKSLFNLENTFL